jgi:hypothetical protein
MDANTAIAVVIIAGTLLVTAACSMRRRITDER